MLRGFKSLIRHSRKARNLTEPGFSVARPGVLVGMRPLLVSKLGGLGVSLGLPHVFCQVLVGHVAGFFPASWLLHEGVGYSPGFALVA